MLVIKRILFVLLFVNLPWSVRSDTWNEPWQKEIIVQSEFFVLANVLSHSDSLGTRIEIVKSFGPNSLSGQVVIQGFSMLNHASYSSRRHLHKLPFREGQTLYFFLSNGEKGHYSIPTPTSGFAYVSPEKNVHATYRHSYHQALVPQAKYESTYSQIWNYYKTNSFDKSAIMEFIEKYIAMNPAGFEENEIDIFFMQHVALETAFLLDIELELEKLQPFVKSDNFHQRVSALQLLGNSTGKKALNFLMDFIVNRENENFEKVIAIWALKKINDSSSLLSLSKIKEDLSTEETGFGGNIMDPRVATYFPSPWQAVDDLENGR